MFTIFSSAIAHIFTEDEAIAQATQQCIWSLNLFIFFSTIKGVQNGVVRALSLQRRNSILTLLFAYGLGVPFAYIFCFKLQMGLQGLWFGIALANGLLVLAIGYLIFSAPWEEIANASNNKLDRKSLII